MKIAYNPKSGAALQTAPDNNDITFDLAGKIIYARGEGFKGTDTTYDIFRKASESVGGYNGLVPAPDYNSNSKNRFLKEDGTWVIPDAGTFDGMDSDRFVTTHNISEADTDKRSINVRFEPKWTDTKSSSYILRVGSSTEGLPDNNCSDGNLLHIQGRFSDTAFLLLSGWKNNSLYFRSGNEVDGINNNTGEEASQGLYKNTWRQIAFRATTLDGYGITDSVKINLATLSTNLNDVNGFGIMANPTNSWATFDKNYPIENHAGTLFYGNSVDGVSSLIYGSRNTNRWFARTSSSSEANRTPWKEFAFKPDVVESLGISNNLLTWIKNGTTNSITIPYSTNTSNVISSEFSSSNSYGSETGISWSLASSTNNGTFGTAIDSNGFAVDNNANGILWLGTHKASTNGGYGGQLGISSNSNIYYRYISNGSFPNAWNKIVFERDLTALNIKLTGYLLDADNFESITSNDTVSSALSKLECKTLFVYDWLMSDTDDTDEKINKWHEVEHFLEEIEETTLNSILNTKADKETTIQDYGLWEKYTDLNEAPMGAFFCGGESVANSPESGHYISGLTLAKDKNAQFRTQLGFVNNRVFTRQENGANNWSQWRELAFLGDVAKKATTLAGYGITDAMPYLGTVDANSVKSSGYAYVTANGAGGNGSLIAFGGTSYQTQLYADYLGGNLYWRVNANGSLTNWKNLLDSHNYSNYAVTLNTNQTISGVKTLSANLLSATRGTLDIGDGYNSFNRTYAWHYKSNSLTKPILSSGKWYRIWNFSQGVAGTSQKNAIISINKAYSYEQGQTITLAVSINNWGQTYVINQLSGTTGLITKVRVTGKWNYSYVDVYISSAENAESYSVSGYGNGERVDFEELADDATNDSTRTEELTVVNGTAVNYPLSLQNATPLVVNSTTMVANLHAQYSTNLMGDNNRDVNEAPYSYASRAVNWRFKRAKAIGLATNDYEYAGVLHLTPWNDSTGGPDHQLAFESNGKIKYRSGLSTWSDWTELLTDANGVTLGTEQIVTGHKTFKNDGYYTSIFNSTLSDGKVRLLLLNNGESKLMLAYDGLGSLLYDYGSAQTLRIQNDGDLLFTKSIIASSQLKSNVATGTSPLAVNSTTMVANLNANYLGGLNKDSFQKAVYDYVNVVGTANDTALPTVLAPSIYNGTNSIGGLFKFYDTKFFSTQTKTSNRCQLAYGYDVDSIHFRRYSGGKWNDWKKVVFTEGTDNLKITNSSARTTYVKDSTHSMFFGYSDGSYNRGLYDNSLSNWIMYTDSSNQTFINQWLGNVGIKTGNATLTAALQVGGSILASGDITAYSDRRLKSNIQTLENRGYVEPVTFEKDGKQCIGFIAQDVEEKYPELVNSEGEYLSLNYQQYTAVLQALIIELDKRIKELENGFSKL